MLLGAREPPLFTPAFRVVSPYRACPLGAHIDHQGGAVLGVPLSAHSLLLAAPAPDSAVRVHALAFPDLACAFRLDDDAFVLESPLPTDWRRYVIAAARVLRIHCQRTLVRGLIAGVAGALPACGVSSSASVGLAYILALAHVNGIALTPVELITLDRSLENDCLGLRNGILDQSSIVLGRRNCLVRINTLTAEHTLLSLPPDARPFRVLLVHSGVPRHLATPASGYNNRVAECRAAAEWLGQRAQIAGAKLLSDIPPAVFAALETELLAHDRAAGLRARHFFSEVERVQRGVVAWQAGDWRTLGALMSESCQSSIQNYECGCAQLEALQRIMVDTPGVYGARFSGAGFGGACVGFVDAQTFDDAAAASIRARYVAQFPDLASECQVHVLDTADGLALI